MTEFTSAVVALRAYNSGTYNATTNPSGYSGVGGMDANWTRSLRDAATVATGVADLADQAQQAVVDVQAIAATIAGSIASSVTVTTLGQALVGSSTQTAARAVIGATSASDVIGQGKHVIAVLGGNSESINGAAFSSLDLPGNKHRLGVYSFDASTSEYLDFLVPMPTSWNEGTITFQVYWRHGTTSTNFGVAWSLQAVAVGDGDTLDAAMGAAVTVTDTGGSATTLYISPESSAVTVAGTPQPGDLVMFRLSRAVSDSADTMAINADFVCAKVLITINSAVEA